jgi:proteasome alpha subunit
VLFVGENPSTTLHKVSEIYDRIAFAAVGKYNEFEQLRVAGIRLADVKGYQYAREDVTGRALANAYANALGAAFTGVEQALRGGAARRRALARRPAGSSCTTSSTTARSPTRSGYVAIGGSTDAITERLEQGHEPGMTRAAALRLARHALSAEHEAEITGERLEVAGLDRDLGRRKFFRMEPAEVEAALASEG